MTKKEEFMIALLEEPTIEKARLRAGLGKTRAFEILNEQEFKTELKLRKSQILASVTNYMQSNLAECAENLMEIIRSGVAAQVRINAIQLMFNTCKAYTEIAEILPRIDALEECKKNEVN